jgi:ankyrin repeat protein/HEAT repeat protein
MDVEKNHILLSLVIICIFGVALPSRADNPSQASLDKSLVSSVRRGNTKRVLGLLESGANPNASNDNNMTAVQYAARGEDTKILKLLIDAGADVNSKDKHGRSPLVEAVGNHNSAAVKLLLSNGAKPDDIALSQACWLGRREAVMLLLDAGANPSSGIPRASQGGHLNLLKLLVERGAKVDASSSSGSSALHLGALQGGTETVAFLIKNGANPNAVNERKETPLHKAISGDCDLDTIKLLVEAGAKPDLANEEGVTPVRLAAIRGENAAYAWLLEANGGEEPRPRLSQNENVEPDVRSTTDLLKELSDRNREARMESQRQLVVRGKEIIPEVLSAIELGAAIETYMDLFAAMGPEAEGVLPALTEMLDEKESVVGARLTMQRMKPGHFASLPLPVRIQADEALYQALKDPKLRETAVYFISWLSDDYCQKLIRSTQPDDRAIGIASASKGRGLQSSETESLLVEVIQSEEEPVSTRRRAIRALVRNGTLSKEGTAALLVVVKSAPPTKHDLPEEEEKKRRELRELSSAAARALGLAGPEIIDELIPLLTPMENPLRPGAIGALKAMGRKSVPRLIELLGDPDNAVATSASVTLNRIGRPAVPALIDTLESDNDKIVSHALSAIWWIGSGARDSEVAVRKLLTAQDRSDDVKLAAARALLKMSPQKDLTKEELRAALPVMIRLLQQGDRLHKIYAAEALGQIGNDANDALPSLRAAKEQEQSKDPQPGHMVIQVVSEAIRRIEQEQ